MAPESTGHSTSHTSSSIYYSTWWLTSLAGSTAGRLVSATSERLSNSQKRVWQRKRQTVWLIMQNWARSLGDQAIHCCYSLENEFCPCCCPPANSPASKPWGGLTRPSSSAGGCLLTHSCKNLGSVGHWAWADHPWHFSPGDLLINLKDRFVEPPAGSAAHGPPPIYMKTNWHSRHRSSITSSPPITPHSFYSLVTSYNILLS